MAVNSKKHIFVFSRGNTTGPAYGATAAQILEFGPDGKYIREIGKNLYAWSFAHAVRVDKDDNLWAVDKGSDMIIKFNPEGRVMMVFGRKKEASDEGAEPWKHVESAASRRRRPVPPAHRRHLGPAGQHLHQRRLHQFARRQVRQERRLGEAVGRRRARKPGEFNTPHSIAADAKGNIYVADRGNRRIQVFDPDGNFLREITIDVPVPPDAAAVDGQSARRSPQPRQRHESGAPWAICITPGPDAVPVQRRRLSRGASTSCRWMARCSGYSAASGRQLKQFGWIHEMACPSENEIYVGRDPELARAEADSASGEVGNRALSTQRRVGQRPRELYFIMALIQMNGVARRRRLGPVFPG